MPTPVPGTTIWLFTIRQRQAAQTILNTILLQREGSGSIVDYENTANQFLDAQANDPTEIIESMRLCQVNGLDYRAISVQPIYPQRYRAVTLDGADWTVPYPVGNLSTTAAPPNVAATLTKKAVVATRRGIGSLHLGGMPATEISGGEWSNAQKVRFQQVAACLEEGLAETGQPTLVWRPVLWNKAIPGTVNLVTQVEVQSTTRVERRRTVRVGI